MKKLIGNGAYGNVYEFKGIAIKEIPNLTDGICLMEIIIMNLTHQNIISAKKIEITYENVVIHQDLALADLYDWYHQHMIPIKVVNLWSQQLMDAISYLHDNNIIHCDIKSKNVLVFENHVKLCDFSISIYNPDKVKATNPNEFLPYTITHRAPEIYLNHTYSRQSDVWAFGCVLYEMMYRNIPFSLGALETPKRTFEIFFQNKEEYLFDKKKKLFGKTETNLHNILFLCLEPIQTRMDFKNKKLKNPKKYFFRKFPEKKGLFERIYFQIPEKIFLKYNKDINTYIDIFISKISTHSLIEIPDDYFEFEKCLMSEVKLGLN